MYFLKPSLMSKLPKKNNQLPSESLPLPRELGKGTKGEGTLLEGEETSIQAPHQGTAKSSSLPISQQLTIN